MTNQLHAAPRADPPRGSLVSRYSKFAVVAFVLGAIVVAHRMGILDAFASPARAKATLVGLGGWGHLAFVFAYTLLQPFGVPGTVFVMAAPLVWPWPVAFALSMAGTMNASVVGFSFARFVARDWVAGRIPARVKKYEEALTRRAFSTVFLLRLIFWMPQWLHAFFGISNVRFSTHFWGSLAGYTPPLLLMSYFGQRIFDMLRAMSTEMWIVTGVATVAIGIGLWRFERSRATR
jgi:uncharacterized membrane protein YdjX (TVP38/TMEM64 family)